MLTLGLLVGSVSNGLAAAPSASAIDGLGGLTSIGDDDLSEEPALPQPSPTGASKPGTERPGTPTRTTSATKKPDPSASPTRTGKPVDTAVNFPPATGTDLTRGPDHRCR